MEKESVRESKVSLISLENRKGKQGDVVFYPRNRGRSEKEKEKAILVRAYRNICKSVVE